METSQPLERLFPRFVGLTSLRKGENAMKKLKVLGAAAILSSAFAIPAGAQEAIQEPGALGQAHPFADYLTGGYGVRGTSRGQYRSYYCDYGRPRCSNQGAVVHEAMLP